MRARTDSLISVLTAQRSEHRGGGENDWRKQPGCAPHGCVAHLPPGRPAQRPGCAWADGDADGGCGQFRVSTCGERLADSLVKFVLGQPTLNERSFERVDHLLAVGEPCPQVAAADGSCLVFSRPCRNGTSLGGGLQDSVARLPSGSHPRPHHNAGICPLSLRHTVRGRSGKRSKRGDA